MKLSLKQIAEFVSGKLKNCEDAEISFVTTDTREIKQGSLFVALRGEKFDGHDFCVDAIKKGATAVISEKKAEQFEEKIPVIEVESTYKALLDLAKGYRESLELRIVGVTGSVGKTTTKDMIAAVLSQGYQTSKTQGNLNNHIGLPRTIFSLKQEDEAAVIEMGMNHFGEISALTRVAQPDLAVLTNIGESHIEFLGSRENILKAKLEILEGMSDSAPIILNYDCDLLSGLILGDRRIIRVSLENENADLYTKNIIEGSEGTRFDIYAYGDFFANVYLSSVGRHNVLNSLFAVAVGLEFGLSELQIAAGLSAYVPSGMRQKVVNKNGITFIEDCYNASPMSMKASLGVLSSLARGRKIAVLGDMLELGDISKEAHLEVGKAACENADMLYCCGELAKYFVEAAEKNGLECKHFETQNDLAQSLVKELKKGDTVLFKASLYMQFDKIVSAVYSALEQE